MVVPTHVDGTVHTFCKICGSNVQSRSLLQYFPNHFLVSVILGSRAIIGELGGSGENEKASKINSLEFNVMHSSPNELYWALTVLLLQSSLETAHLEDTLSTQKIHPLQHLMRGPFIIQ